MLPSSVLLAVAMTPVSMPTVLCGAVTSSRLGHPAALRSSQKYQADLGAKRPAIFGLVYVSTAEGGCGGQ